MFINSENSGFAHITQVNLYKPAAAQNRTKPERSGAPFWEHSHNMKYFLAALSAAAGALILLNPETVSGSVSSAVRDCLEVIVPSLFAFTVLAIWLQSSGLYRLLLRPITLPLSRLLRMDEELCAVIVLGNIGGYPVGAKLLSRLTAENRLSREDAGRLLCCCFGSGPSFVVGIVGVRIFNSAAVGMIIFAACFCSSLIIAAAVRFKGEISLKNSRSSFYFTAECFTDSVMSGARVMFTVCVMIAAFAVIFSILDILKITSAAGGLFSFIGAGELSESILPAFLEVTRVKALKPTAEWVMPLCAGLLSFGGICVHIQVMAVARGIPLKSFILSRLPAALLSALLSLPALLLPQPATETLSPAAEARPFSASALISASVLIMCGILLAGRKDKNGPKKAEHEKFRRDY